MALACGAPWGAAAWGGANEGTLPLGLRLASGLAGLIWIGVAMAAFGKILGPIGRRRLLVVAAAYCSVGVLANAASPSAMERAIWVPLTLFGATAAWLSWREARRISG